MYVSRAPFKIHGWDKKNCVGFKLKWLDIKSTNGIISVFVEHKSALTD